MDLSCSLEYENGFWRYDPAFSKDTFLKTQCFIFPNYINTVDCICQPSGYLSINHNVDNFPSIYVHIIVQGIPYS